MNEMENDSSSAVGVKEISLPLRDDLVYTAVKFLQNPRVSSRPKSEKEVFLQKKGLTHAEIQAAFEAAGVNASQDAVGHYSAVKLAQVQGYSPLKSPSKSKWVIVRDILNAVVLFAGAAYSLRYLYRRFIAPLLFRKKEKSLGEKVDEMNKNLTVLVTDLSAAIQNLSETVATLRARQTEKSEMKELKSEVASLKALLLGRRQFPAPPVIVSSPSIPAWQMAATSTSGEKLDLRPNQNSRKINHGDGISLSSSPEIIQVDDSLANQLPNVDPNSLARDPSESSESNSAEMVDMGASNSGGSGEEDTD